jgi:hypothetical protein
MDLSTFDTAAAANDGAVLELRSPNDGSVILQDDGETPVSITLLGEDSDRVTKHNNVIANRALRSGPGGPAMSAEVARENEIAKFAKATVSWSGVEVDKQTLDCTEDNAKALYRRFPWIRDQVRVFMADRAHFTKGSAAR